MHVAVLLCDEHTHVRHSVACLPSVLITTILIAARCLSNAYVFVLVTDIITVSANI